MKMKAAIVNKDHSVDVKEMEIRAIQAGEALV